MKWITSSIWNKNGIITWQFFFLYRTAKYLARRYSLAWLEFNNEI